MVGLIQGGHSTIFLYNIAQSYLTVVKAPQYSGSQYSCVKNNIAPDICGGQTDKGTIFFFALLISRRPEGHWFDGAADRQLSVVPKTMKILNWNIWDGGLSKKAYKNSISRIGDIARSILSHLPEVAVITEFRNNPLGEGLIRKLFKTKGTTLEYCHINKKLRPEDNTVEIFSALPIKPLNDLLKLEDQFSRHYQCVEINSVIFVAVFCARNVNAMESIIDAIVNNTELIEQDSIIVGDFDTGPIKSNVKKAGNLWFLK